MDLATVERMTLPMLAHAVQGWEDVEQRRAREAWERTRWHACALLQPHMKKGKKLRPSDLIRFPWDAKKGSGWDQLRQHRNR